MEESYPGERITLPVELTFASGYMSKKLTHLPEPRYDNSACARSGCLTLIELTWLGEPKCLYG